MLKHKIECGKREHRSVKVKVLCINTQQYLAGSYSCIPDIIPTMNK